jgi:hypothetical protein
MRKRYVITISTLVVLAVVIVGVCLLSSRHPRETRKEPSYQGRKLTDWLGDIHPGSTELPAARAVMAIGTNGVPTMLELIRAKDQDSRDRGSFGLLILGCNVQASVPLIIPELLADTNSQDRELSGRAALILQGIQSRAKIYPR